MLAEHGTGVGINFFLTGLPRSRTAWFSEFLSCLHEGMVGCYTKSEYINKIGNGGDSSSALMYFPLEDYFSDAPVVIVERDMDEVIHSLENVGLRGDGVIAMLNDSKRRMDKMKGLRVDFHNLNMEEIWSHLIGGGFDKERAEELSKMNIQKVNLNPDLQAFKGLMGELWQLG